MKTNLLKGRKCASGHLTPARAESHPQTQPRPWLVAAAWSHRWLRAADGAPPCGPHEHGRFRGRFPRRALQTSDLFCVCSHPLLLLWQPATPTRTIAATPIQTLPQSQPTPKRIDNPSLEEPSDLEELEQFAKTFKQRRIKLGFTQVGRAHRRAALPPRPRPAVRSSRPKHGMFLSLVLS